MKVNCHQIEQQECVEIYELPQVPRTRGDDNARGDDEWTGLHEEHMSMNNGEDQSGHDICNSASGKTTTLAGDLQTQWEWWKIELSDVTGTLVAISLSNMS